MPVDLINLAEHEAIAKEALDAGAWAYVQGGAGDEQTLRANAQAWQDLQLLPRVMQPLAGGHTRIKLLGRSWAHPLLAAPMAYQRAVHPQGEIAMALACAAQGAGLVLSTQASVRMEDVALHVLSEPDRGPLWFQLYLQPDPGFNRELAQRAQAAGYEALVLTVDAPVSGVRDRERREQWRLPAGVGAPNLEGLRPPAAPALAAGQSRLFDGLLRHAPTWKDLAWLKEQTSLPVLIKGLTHPADVPLALQHGADGLIVSNHGGRNLDTVPATARLLPAIVRAAEGRVPVLVDGGLRRGTDVLKAMALGASAVLVGRPLLHGLAHDGALGVAQVIRTLRDELEVAMALCGCARLDQAGQDILA